MTGCLPPSIQIIASSTTDGLQNHNRGLQFNHRVNRTASSIFWQTWLTHSLVPTIFTLLFAFILASFPGLVTRLPLDCGSVLLNNLTTRSHASWLLWQEKADSPE